MKTRITEITESAAPDCYKLERKGQPTLFMPTFDTTEMSIDDSVTMCATEYRIAIGRLPDIAEVFVWPANNRAAVGCFDVAGETEQ